MENVLREAGDGPVTADDVRTIAAYDPASPAEVEIPFTPARVLLQDFTGVPAVVDLAALRSAMARVGGDPEAINPRVPVDLVIDHSVQVDSFALPQAFQINADIEFQRNAERYEFLRWGAKAFDNFSVVPPERGICHQVNLEYIAKGVWTRTEDDGTVVAYPDTLVGTDSHTTMINGLGVLGWGVGGIEAEAAMLGQPAYMLMPRVVGFKLSGKLREGVTATDLTLTVTQMLRAHGVVGDVRRVLRAGPLVDVAPGPRDDRQHGARVRRHDGLLPRRRRDAGLPAPHQPLRGDRRPRRAVLQGAGPLPHRRHARPDVRGHARARPRRRRAVAWPARSARRTASSCPTCRRPSARASRPRPARRASASPRRDATGTYVAPDGTETELKHGAVAIAAITSCTNTSNPSVMLAAGLLAKNAVEQAACASSRTSRRASRRAAAS